MTARRFANTLVVSAFAFVLGCSSDRVPTYPVQGVVEFADGTPVRTGHVEFESVDHGTTASGRIEDDGSFVLGTYTTDDGAAPGDQRVLVLQIVRPFSHREISRFRLRSRLCVDRLLERLMLAARCPGISRCLRSS